MRELVEGRGCEVLFLPPYSPDFSPVEEAFSKLETLLKSGAARTARRWWRRSGEPSMPSRRGTRSAGSSAAGTRSEINARENRWQTATATSANDHQPLNGLEPSYTGATVV